MLRLGDRDLRAVGDRQRAGFAARKPERLGDRLAVDLIRDGKAERLRALAVDELLFERQRQILMPVPDLQNAVVCHDGVGDRAVRQRDGPVRADAEGDGLRKLLIAARRLRLRQRVRPGQQPRQLQNAVVAFVVSGAAASSTGTSSHFCAAVPLSL